ncbi:hypothetical protein ACFW6Q_26725 [Streptomyces sp. NPDC058737]|uniref:hypothetical protein n=1 Tax=Streptomyces sp. NPDC058737 TaxID=3346617 RepID=UPI00368292E0
MAAPRSRFVHPERGLVGDSVSDIVPLPMLDLVDKLAREYEAVDPADARHVGLAYALKVLT